MAGRSCSPARLRVEGVLDAAARQVAVEADARSAPCRGATGGRRWPPRCWRRAARAPDPGRGQVGHQAVEEVELALGEGAVLRLLAVGHRQVGPDALELQQRLGQPRRPRWRGRSSGAAPTRCMPVSTFTWTATGGPAAAAAALKARDPLCGVQRRREPVGQRRRRGGGIALAQQEDRRRDAVLAQLDPLVDQGHGEPPCAAGQRGPGHGRPTVAVAVRLDDRAELGRARPGGPAPRRCGVTAARSISAQAGRERPWAMVTGAVVVRRHRAASAGRQLAGAQSLRQPSAAPPRAAPPPGPAGRRPPGPAPGRATRPARARGRPRPPPASGGEPAGAEGADDAREHVAAPRRGQRRPTGRGEQDVGRRRCVRARPPR